MSKISTLLISSCRISQGISDIWLERKLNWPKEHSNLLVFRFALNIDSRAEIIDPRKMKAPMIA
jgi:hypothetical protein